MEVKDIFVIIPFVLLPTVLGFFSWMLYKKNQITDIEKTQTAVYSTSCSGIIGLLRFNGPFIRLSIYDSMIVISYYKKIILMNSEIINIVSQKKCYRKYYRSNTIIRNSRQIFSFFYLNHPGDFRF